MVNAFDPTGGGSGTGSTDDDPDVETSDDEQDTNVVPTGANNPTSYETDGDGGLEETTLGGNTVADAVDSVSYDDTSVDEQESTSDAPSTTEEIIDSVASGDGTPEFSNAADEAANVVDETAETVGVSELVDSIPWEKASTVAGVVTVGGLAVAVLGGGSK